MSYSTTWLFTAGLFIFFMLLAIFGTWHTMLACCGTREFTFRHAAGYTLLIAGVLTLVMLGVLALIVVLLAPA
jgi:hypothetical protein